MALERWLSNLRESTQRVYIPLFRNWVIWMRENGGEFAGLGPDGLVEWQRAHYGSFKILDLLQRYVRGIYGSANYKRNIYNVVRSFFGHNRAELPRDRRFNIRGDVPKVVGNISVDEFTRVLNVSNPMYRALWLCMFQGGMGIGEAIYFSQNGLNSILSQLSMGQNPVKVDLPGRKKNRNEKPYYTFLGRDSVEALRHWLKIRPRTDYEDVFLTGYGTPITDHTVRCQWLRTLHRLGIITIIEGGGPTVRYGKNMHELRDLFRTRWQKSGRAPEVAEFCMGHIIDPLGYNKAMNDENYVRFEYIQASDWLNILSKDPENLSRDEVIMREQQIRGEMDERFKDMEEQIRLMKEYLKRH